MKGIKHCATIALMRGIHPPDNIQIGGRPGGGMPLISALARTMASAFDRGSGYAFFG